MTMPRMATACLAMLIAASCAVCDTVYQEHFSDDPLHPWVEYDWVYNNSGSNGAKGPDGNDWPGRISEDGHELLGFQPAPPYYATSFETFIYYLPLSGQDGWTGSGAVASYGHNGNRCLEFSYKQAAHRNVTDNPQRTVQYVQCYVKSSTGCTDSYVKVGTQDALLTAASVRLASNGKIQAFHGTLPGGADWVDVSDYLLDIWYCIFIKLDYAAKTYDVTVRGCGEKLGLGFVEPGAESGLGSVKFEQGEGYCYMSVDGLYAGNTPYPPGYGANNGTNGAGREIGSYWKQPFHQWCLNYAQEPGIAPYPAYDWMSGNDALGNAVNTDTDKAAPYKAKLPAGWTAAFQGWADCEPNSWVGADCRGRMGFTRMMSSFEPADPTKRYTLANDNPCLHIWSSHGPLRVVSPNISTGPGVYTLDWKASVWNGLTADPAMQYKWTDWCSWGFGYTNWCPWDGDPLTKPPYLDGASMDIDAYWTFQDDPFHKVNPDGWLDGIPPEYKAKRDKALHPADEEPGMWHEFSREFAFGLAPEKDGVYYTYQADPGYFIGFKVAHSAAPGAAAGDWRWATILNVDDIVLTKKDPVTIPVAKDLPVGSLVEITDLVIANMVLVPWPDYDLYSTDRTQWYLDVYLEKEDRTAGILLRAYGDVIDAFWDSVYQQFKFQLGDVVRVVGAISKHDKKDPRTPPPPDRNPVKYISMWTGGKRLPAMVWTGAPPVDLKPVALNSRSLVGKPVTAGTSNDGMLVTVFGRVNHSRPPSQGEAPYFYVDDGGKLAAGKPRWDPEETDAFGIRVDCTSLLPFWPSGVQDNRYVAVTGTCTAEMNPIDHTTVVRVVCPRLSTDVVLVSE